MRSRYMRALASGLVIAATVGFFIYYVVHHPGVGKQLGRLSPGSFIILLLLYIGTTVALTFVTVSTLRLCAVRLSRNESILITAYSSIINFFGPLQSGPAFRGIYLKKKHGLKLRNYTAATFIYYFFYALFSGLFLISGLLHYWTLLIVVLVFGGLYWAQKQQNLPDRIKRLQLGGWWFVALAALLQVCIVAAIYYVELHTIAPGTSLSQVIIYTGAANFALFVSITPGAIGFRESFLVFSQNLHHISNTTIVTANIIDRAMYIVLLGVLAVFIFGSHAQRRLKVS